MGATPRWSGLGLHAGADLDLALERTRLAGSEQVSEDPHSSDVWNDGVAA